MVTQCWCEHTAGAWYLMERYLVISCQTVPDLFPVNKVLTLKNGNSRKKLKRTAC